MGARLARGRRPARVLGLASPFLLLTSLALAEHAAVLPVALREPFTSALPATDARLPLGVPLPHLLLESASGTRVDLRASDDHPTVLVVFRGVRCPWCRGQLATLAEQEPRYRAAGVRVLGLCPDPPSALASLAEEMDLGFPLLSDEREDAVSALCDGKAHCTVIADADGTIRWADVSESWRDAPQAGDVLHAAWRLRR